MPSPIRPTSSEARQMAARLLHDARHGALGVIDPATGDPMVTRVASIWIDGALHLLVSDLSSHTAALTADPRCSMLISDAARKGDPLAHPRLTIQCRATFVEKPPLRDPWLTAYPKARLYIDFADFRMVRLTATAAHLNGGFGKAYRLTPADLNQ